MGLRDYVRFEGAQRNVKKYYEKADVFLMCSKSEAFGRVTVEAMMSGCLVIGANSGCTPELIKNKKTGLLYKSGDYKDLANTIKYVLENKKNMQECARNGRAFMLKNMTAEENANNIIKIYNSI